MDPNNPYPNPQQVKQRGSGLKWFAGTILVAVIVSVAVWFYTSFTDRQRLAAVMAEIDRADPGWRWGDIEAARHRVADEQNSATKVLKAHALMPRSWPSTLANESLNSFYNDAHQHPEAQLDPEICGTLRSELAAVPQALAEARQIVEFGDGKFAMRHARSPFRTLLPHLQQTRELANVLWYDSFLRAQDGELEQALTSMHALVQTGRSIGDEPFLVSMLVRLAIRNMSIRATERVLAQGEVADSGLAKLQAALMQEEKEPLLINSLRGERAAFDLFLEGLDSGSIDSSDLSMMFAGGGPGRSAKQTGWDWLDDKLASAWPTLAAGSIPKNRAALLDHFTQVIELAREPLHLQESKMRELEEASRTLPPLGRILIPASSKSAAAFRRCQAETRCAIVALAAERFRLATGRWPETLSELTPKYLPQIPNDPFDGAPLRYRKTPEGALIYTVGPDGKDDGGKIDRTKGGNTPGIDLGFWLFDVDKRRQACVPWKAEQ
jgi:hypothetical protein